MTKLTVTEAAKLARISRQHFYKKYINTGVISITKEFDKSFVILSELLRVFPNLSIDTKNDNTDDKNLHYLTVENQDFTHIIDSKNQTISILEQQLIESKNREEWLKLQLEKATHYLENIPRKRKRFLGIF